MDVIFSEGLSEKINITKAYENSGPDKLWRNIQNDVESGDENAVAHCTSKSVSILFFYSK